MLSWELLFLTSISSDPVLPFYINWGTSPHPAQTAPSAAVLKSLTVGTPNEPIVASIFASMKLDVPVTYANENSIRATIKSRNGEIILESSPETMTIQSKDGICDPETTNH